MKSKTYSEKIKKLKKEVNIKIKITHEFKDPGNGSIGTRTTSKDFESLPRRIFIRIGKLITREDFEKILLPGVNAYNYGKYEEAIKFFKDIINICPKVEEEIHPYIEICNRVIATKKNEEDIAYEESVSKWLKKPIIIQKLFKGSAPIFKIRCKYCGHYTPCIDPMSGVAYLGLNNCEICGRGYPVPDHAWDSIDGQAYIYYRHSVTEEEFYKEFEDKYEVNPDHTYFLKSK